jgi:hypothetical protein
LVQLLQHKLLDGGSMVLVKEHVERACEKQVAINLFPVYDGFERGELGLLHGEDVKRRLRSMAIPYAFEARDAQLGVSTCFFETISEPLITGRDLFAPVV